MPVRERRWVWTWARSSVEEAVPATRAGRGWSEGRGGTVGLSGWVAAGRTSVPVVSTTPGSQTAWAKPGPGSYLRREAPRSSPGVAAPWAARRSRLCLGCWHVLSCKERQPSLCLCSVPISRCPACHAPALSPASSMDVGLRAGRQVKVEHGTHVVEVYAPGHACLRVRSPARTAHSRLAPVLPVWVFSRLSNRQAPPEPCMEPLDLWPAHPCPALHPGAGATGLPRGVVRDPGR